MPRYQYAPSPEKYRQGIEAFNQVIADRNNDILAPIKKMFGPDGKLPIDWPNAEEFNNIEIEIPDGMDYNIVGMNNKK